MSAAVNLLFQKLDNEKKNEDSFWEQRILAWRLSCIYYFLFFGWQPPVSPFPWNLLLTSQRFQWRFHEEFLGWPSFLDSFSLFSASLLVLHIILIINPGIACLSNIDWRFLSLFIRELISFSFSIMILGKLSYYKGKNLRNQGILLGHKPLRFFPRLAVLIFLF